MLPRSGDLEGGYRDPYGNKRWVESGEGSGGTGWWTGPVGFVSTTSFMTIKSIEEPATSVIKGSGLLDELLFQFPKNTFF